MKIKLNKIMASLFLMMFILFNINAVSLINQSNQNLALKRNFKDAVCGAIGCDGGDRLCGTASATVSVDLEGVGAEVEVEYTCYEES